MLIGIPLGFYADRHDRVRIAAAGAALWTLFSLGTGAHASAGHEAHDAPKSIGPGAARQQHDSEASANGGNLIAEINGT